MKTKASIVKAINQRTGRTYTLAQTYGDYFLNLDGQEVSPALSSSGMLRWLEAFAAGIEVGKAPPQ